MVKEKRRENVLIEARPSRKQYIPFYLMVLFLLGLLIYLNFKGVELSGGAVTAFLLFFFIGLNLTEVHRRNTLYRVTPNNILCIYDYLLNKNVQKIDYFGISDIYVENGLWQWLLDYGNILVRLFSKDATIKIKNINKPNEFADVIEKVMMDHRNPEKNRRN